MNCVDKSGNQPAPLHTCRPYSHSVKSDIHPFTNATTLTSTRSTMGPHWHPPVHQWDHTDIHPFTNGTTLISIRSPMGPHWHPPVHQWDHTDIHPFNNGTTLTPTRSTMGPHWHPPVHQWDHTDIQFLPWLATINTRTTFIGTCLSRKNLIQPLRDKIKVKSFLNYCIVNIFDTKLSLSSSELGRGAYLRIDNRRIEDRRMKCILEVVTGLNKKQTNKKQHNLNQLKSAHSCDPQDMMYGASPSLEQTLVVRVEFSANWLCLPVTSTERQEGEEGRPDASAHVVRSSQVISLPPPPPCRALERLIVSLLILSRLVSWKS